MNTHRQRSSIWRWLANRLTILILVYLTCLFIWMVLYLVFNDHWPALFILNAVAVYLFLPLPFFLAANLILKHRLIWFGTAAGITLWLLMYGSLFVPRLAAAKAPSPTFTVMTYNVLSSNEKTEGVIEGLEASEADVIGLVELYPELAEAIAGHLADQYPFQILEPRVGVSGLGLISRYPMTPLDTSPAADSWLGQPPVVNINFNGRPVTLVLFHAIPMVTTGGLSGLSYSIERREQQAQAVVELAATTKQPFIALGDLNAGDKNQAYDILAGKLIDAWQSGGWGFGHTFPGAASAKSSRPVLLGFPVPMWLLRIDFIFHSADWETQKAWIGPWEGGSDHRPVIARLALQD